MNALRDEKRETRAERRESETALPCHLNEGRSCGLIVKKNRAEMVGFFCFESYQTALCNFSKTHPFMNLKSYKKIP